MHDMLCMHVLVHVHVLALDVGALGDHRGAEHRLALNCVKSRVRVFILKFGDKRKEGIRLTRRTRSHTTWSSAVRTCGAISREVRPSRVALPE